MTKRKKLSSFLSTNFFVTLKALFRLRIIIITVLGVFILSIFASYFLTKKINKIPPNWTVRNSAVCGVKIPIPPNKSPYIEDSNTDFKKFWQLRELSFKRLTNDGNSLFKSEVFVALASSLNGTDDFPGSILIECAPNTGYSLEKLPELYASSFAPEQREYAKLLSKRKTNLWGKSVIIGVFNGSFPAPTDSSTSYFTLTKKYIYKITKVSDNPNHPFAAKTTNEIFSKLSFEE